MTSVWGAAIMSHTHEVVGLLRISPKLHLTSDAARAEITEWLADIPPLEGAPINWEVIDDDLEIGHLGNSIVVIRRFELP
jgi:hypothetical protein